MQKRSSCFYRKIVVFIRFQEVDWIGEKILKLELQEKCKKKWELKYRK
jgi:hypothetical protein